MLAALVGSGSVSTGTETANMPLVPSSWKVKISVLSLPLGTMVKPPSLLVTVAALTLLRPVLAPKYAEGGAGA